VAAQLALGAPLATVGDPLDPAELKTLDVPRPRVSPGEVVAHVVHVDRFGNAVLSAEHDDLAGSGLKLGRAVEVRVDGGPPHEATHARTFADVPADRTLVYEDATRTLAVAVNRGDAARRLDLRPGSEVRITPA